MEHDDSIKTDGKTVIFIPHPQLNNIDAAATTTTFRIPATYWLSKAATPMSPMSGMTYITVTLYTPTLTTARMTSAAFNEHSDTALTSMTA